MDYYDTGNFGRDRLSQFHAEAREWNLAKRVEAGQRQRNAHTFQPTRAFSVALRYGTATLSAIATALTSLIR
jgi:hypothetical protein